MGKSKQSKGKVLATPKCTCDDPYKCFCGNRPERPSKGHKWDGEKWAGKGHKQRGAGPQAVTVGVAAAVTNVGNTTVKQWQKLPSKILEEWCKKEKRPHPICKSVGKQRSLFSFRVILPDPKKKERDMMFTPKEGCENEEQAKEEACILALLNTSPKIPHERVLPEPYRTTWLNAIELTSKNDMKMVSTPPGETVTNDSTADMSSTAANEKKVNVAASSNLIAASKFASMADRKRHEERVRQAKRKKELKQEANDLANKDHVVFMSSKLRKEIELYLRSYSNYDVVENYCDYGEFGNAQEEVLTSLEGLGFKRDDSFKAYQVVHSSLNESKDSESMKELCLQWLCINLDEADLPDNFDPRGRTLDVIRNTTGQPSQETERSRIIAVEYGTDRNETRALNLLLKDDEPLCFGSHDLIRKAIVGAICKSLEFIDDQEILTESLQLNEQVLQEEIESLEAIFEDQCRVKKHESNNDQTLISLVLEGDGNENNKKLEILIDCGLYPTMAPQYALICGNWKSEHGMYINQKLMTFMSSMPRDEPMIYSIFMHATELLQNENKYSSRPSFSAFIPSQKTHKSAVNAQEVVPRLPPESQTDLDVRSQTTTPREIRVKDTFWSTKCHSFPPAKTEPSIKQSIKLAREKLPAAQARTEFINIIHEIGKTGKVCLVTGETGCGKTTQIPQFILENEPYSKIVVTQPRRLAATGVASRVAFERGEDTPGKQSVGYIVRGETAIARHTRLLFCTTGILLRQLQSEHALECIDYIIVDEVHERSLDSDILLGLLKRLLPHNPQLKLILMSATMDADRIAAYWGKNTPRMHIPGFTFPVSDFMLEDVLAITNYIPSKKSETASNRGNITNAGGNELKSEPIDKHSVQELMTRIDEATIDYDMIAILVKTIIQNAKLHDNGTLLIFFPGAPEISKAEKAIRRIVGDQKILLLQLHGGLLPKDQNVCFEPARSGYRKVILSTNIAQTSITIPDVTVVIDTCREKQSSFDPVSRMPLLVEQFASKDALQQRRGRAGRVQEGICFKLISKSTLSGLPEHTEPEIHRCSLDQAILSLFFLNFESGRGEFLSTLLDPPSQKSIQASLSGLEQIGALENINGLVKLTFLGIHLAKIPAPPRIGKLLVMGSLLGCRSAALAIAASLSISRSPLERISGIFKKVGQRDERDQSIIEEREAILRNVGNSDHLLLAYAFSTWFNSEKQGKRNLCDQLGLIPAAMREIKQLYTQLEASLTQAGFNECKMSDKNSTSNRVVRACIVSAFSPSQLVKLKRPVTKYNETVEGSIEKDVNSRELKLFIRGRGGNEEQVFIHPSSSNINVSSYSCPWLVYNNLVRTTKAYLRDVTECTTYSLLLFGGRLKVQASEEIIVVDNWVRLSAAPRIGALIGALRQRVDDVLHKKIIDPKLIVSDTSEMKIVVKLLTSDGLL